MEFLKECGVEKCFVGVNEHEEYDSDSYWTEPTAELFIFFPDNISTETMVEIMVEIGRSYPDELDQKDDGSLRLWWD